MSRVAPLERLTGHLRPSSTVPIRYFATGLVAFALFQVGAALAPSALIGRPLLVPAVVAATHLVTLGWLSSVMIGAVYQIVPVLLHAPLPGERPALAVHLFHAVGTLALVAGFGLFTPVLIGLGAALVGAAALLFLGHVLLALRRVPAWNVHGYGLATAVLFYGITVGLGLALAAVWLGWVPGPFWPLLRAHVVAGYFGWFTVGIVGVGSRLVPMFAPVGSQYPRLSAWSLLLVTLGVLGAELFFLYPVSPLLIGAALLPTGLLLFAWDTARIYAGRKTGKPVEPVLFFTATALVVLTGTALYLVAPWPIPDASAWAAVAWLGGPGFMVLGQLTKIIPFIATIDYTALGGKPPVPKVAELFSDQTFFASYFLFLLQLVALLLGSVVGVPSLPRLAFVAGAAGAILFVAAIGAGYRRRNRLLHAGSPDPQQGGR